MLWNRPGLPRSPTMGFAAIGRMTPDRKVEDLHITPVVFREA